MSFVVSARKYRPQKFEEVFGQAHITDTLKTAILSDKLAHAFLFTGPRGVGKTTCARILAKVINAPEPKTAVQDGSYASMQIDIALNIFELDAASNNSVDHIRSLVEQVRIPPQVGKYKVFIIDEVHMLSQAAFNAFLKTLEEPPPYAIFILATTEKHKIIPTILSRCQIFDFKRIQIKEMVDQMENIAKEEKVDIDREALHLIAEKADGAMRDALSIFDRIVNSAEDQITRDYVVSQLNILDYDYFFKSTDAILKEDKAALMLIFDEVLRNGFESDHYLNGLSEHCRNLLVSKDVATQNLIQVSETLRKRYLNQGQLFSSSNILSALNILNQADVDYPRAKNKRLHTEIALLKLCYLTRAKKIVKQNGQQTKTIAKSKESNATVSKVKDITATVKTPPKIIADQPIIEEPVSAKKVDKIKESPEGSAAPKTVASETSNTIEIQNTPSLSNLDSLINGFRDTKEKVAADVKSLDIDQVNTIWSKYLGKVTSPSTINALSRTQLSLSDSKLIVKVPNQLAKDMILQESILIQLIRDELNVPQLELNIDIDKEAFPNVESAKPRKYLSEKEKYDALVKLNPKLADLVKKFKMKIDN